MLIRFGDIRDQSRKLSKIAQNFGRFFGPPKCLGRAFQKLYQVYHSCLSARRLKKFHEDIPTSPEVIEPNTLNFRPNFKFSRLKFFFFWGGGPPSQLGCALGSLGQSLTRVKISGRSTPQGPRYSMPKKCTFSGSKLTCNSKPLVNRSSRDFFR